MEFLLTKGADPRAADRTGETPLHRAALRGDRIAFTAGGIEYTGQVLGDTMQGEFRSVGTTGRWSAVRVSSR